MAEYYNRNTKTRMVKTVNDREGNKVMIGITVDELVERYEKFFVDMTSDEPTVDKNSLFELLGEAVTVVIMQQKQMEKLQSMVAELSSKRTRHRKN